MADLMGVAAAIRLHAKAEWKYTEEDLATIELRKVDVAVDLKGSFMPQKTEIPYNIISDSLQREISNTFDAPETNFLSLKKLTDLSVKRGDNCLKSCFQYIV